MRKDITINVTDEELILLTGILYYSEGAILDEVFHKLMDNIPKIKRTFVKDVAREIAVTGNGYYINEDDLMRLIGQKMLQKGM